MRGRLGRGARVIEIDATKKVTDLDLRGSAHEVMHSERRWVEGMVDY